MSQKLTLSAASSSPSLKPAPVLPTVFLETRVKVKPDQTKGQTLGKQGDKMRKPGEDQGVELVEQRPRVEGGGGAILGGASRQLRQGFELLVGGEVRFLPPLAFPAGLPSLPTCLSPVPSPPCASPRPPNPDAAAGRRSRRPPHVPRPSFS